ncbi:tripartite tricarboxylate transporter TctB family protein [Vibrio sp. Vb339]|uniref:tripartite tricarboxylate transporter TctB family protein n=1 Tax=Vibrio sp. Vb339 TaxID=1192013 RepID=UPI0015566C9F|nr:tripartite tricarboxylate transporter TctB family protein [Vibrio sp. Vb339]
MIGRLISIAIFVSAAIYASAATGYSAGFGDPLGPKVFPLMISIPTMLLSASLIAYPGRVGELTDTYHLVKQISFTIALFTFVFLLEKIGYVLSSIILISTISILLDAKPKQALVVGMLVTPILWVTFDKLLNLPLPFLGSWIS